MMTYFIITVQSTAAVDDMKGELKKTLGLLLKHRGGPGFGHGRLQGNELTVMQNNLRNIADKLMEEAQLSVDSNADY